ncbi:MotE family protein [Roseiconus lacunae]|uniref:Magnesium transporter MgtE intracellular domain-containing protein n=1 Tax=Roseiconus lacunae TaxID=2605694 RepID=A0ABT7PDG0_9BACT|nr:hypothetical protein [Roseiconus lacunae]MCD0459813.1 hypothetical protein [Roseiconus lacunae]MDM4014511.1 hypothetical protein [Roseiconus lacunae]WRQ49824.1 hypothetical protein U8335_23070 [Stieleria sp. HD01]
MKAIIAAMLTCVIIFGLSAGATHMFLKSDPAEPPEDPSELTEPTPDDVEMVAEDTGDPMPVSFRPDANVSVEAVLQMSDSIKRMEQELAEREQKVKRDEMRVKLMFDDLSTEQDELKAFSDGIETKIAVLEQLKNEVAGSLASLDEQKAAIEKAQAKAATSTKDAAPEVDDRVNDVKSWFSNLAPEQAANYLREFANSGKISFAASLLQKMPDRQKSKILAAMNDPVLVDQLIDALGK